MTPKNLAEALAIRRDRRVIPFAGGTDLMVRRRSWAGTLPAFEEAPLFLGGLEELQVIRREDVVLHLGAAATLTDILDNQATPEILKRALAEMAAPAIRNAGTLGGNICNASPAADSLPPLYALGASVLLQSAAGAREVPIEAFITGPGRTDLRHDELLVAVTVPLAGYGIVYYRKVGARKADALAKVSFAGLAKVADGRVEDVRIALGAVAPRVVRSRQAEDLCRGKRVDELPGLLAELKAIYAGQIRPIDDQRSNAAYRSAVSLRLIEYFLSGLGQPSVSPEADNGR